MDIMLLYKGRLDAQIDYLFSPPAHICWQCVGLYNYEEAKKKEAAVDL